MFKKSLLAATAAILLSGVSAQASPTFSSTSNPSSWQVATNVGGADGQFSSFPTSGFTTAVGTVGRTTGGIGWIANNSTGTNGPIGDWTFFVFQQTFDLTGYNPATADLQFQWAADDSGQGFAARGTWVPQLSLNGGSLIPGSWPPIGDTYSFGDVMDLSSGFVAGLNTIDFYVEGNGMTDGFALMPVGFTATSTGVPEPVTLSLFGAGLAGAAALRRRKKKVA